MEAAAEEPEQEQTSDVSIALALVSSREEGFSLTASSGGAGRERTASASLVLGRSCCADSDVTAEVPAVGTGSIWVFFRARVIAPTSPRVSPLDFHGARVSLGLHVFGAVPVQRQKGAGECKRVRYAMTSAHCGLGRAQKKASVPCVRAGAEPAWTHLPRGWPHKHFVFEGGEACNTKA